MSKLKAELLAMGVSQAEDLDSDAAIEDLAINVYRAMAIAYLEVCTMVEQAMGAEIPGKDPLIEYARGVRREGMKGVKKAPIVEDLRGESSGMDGNTMAAMQALANKVPGPNRAARRQMRRGR